MVTWLLALYLYGFGYSDLLEDLSYTTVSYILSSIFAVSVGWFLCSIIFMILKKSKINRAVNDFSKSSRAWVFFLSVFAFLGVLFEVAYFRGAPLFTALGYGTIGYHDFGIPTLHGLLSAIVLSLSMYALYSYLKTSSKKFLCYYSVTLLVPVLAMSRGGLVSFAIQSVLIYVIFSGLSFAKLLRLALIFLIGIMIFGYIGELRNSDVVGLYDSFFIADNYPEYMPKGFIWVYMYITTPLNNVNNVIAHYNDWAFNVYGVFHGFLPTFIRQYFDAPQIVNLVNEAFNVSSFMPVYLYSFGYYGSLIFYFLSSFVAVFISYKYRQTLKLSYGFAAIILMHSAVLSIFSDFYFLQVYFFQLLIQFLVFRK